MADRNGNTTVVIFGASGDLAQRKLGPALFHLLDSGALPDLCSFVGVARSDYSDEGFRNFLRKGVGEVENSHWDEFASHVSYFRGSSTDVSTLKLLDAQISANCNEGQDDNRVTQRLRYRKGRGEWIRATLTKISTPLKDHDAVLLINVYARDE